MILNQPKFFLKNIAATTLTIAAISTCLTLEGANSPQAFSRTPALLEYRWNPDDNYKKLFYYQSSHERRRRSTYYLVISSRNRKTEIQKLSINFPKHFDTSITPNQLKLCSVELGGMFSKTSCKETIPASFKVNFDKQKSIEVIPTQPIPINKKKYAITMKIFNPSKAGMFQINALAQSSGEKPVSRYVGSWNIDIR